MYIIYNVDIINELYNYLNAKYKKKGKLLM